MYHFKTIARYHQDLQQGNTNCVNVVEGYLAAIDSAKNLNAFVEVFKEEALQKAKLLDDQRKGGAALKKLHGVVIAIKDVICYEGHKVTAASGILENFVSQYSASAVQLLLDEDAIIIGSCN